MDERIREKAKGLYFRLSDAIYRYQTIGDSKSLVYMLKELERFYKEINDLPPQKQVSSMLDKGEPFDFWDMDTAKGLLHGIYDGPGWKDEFLRLPWVES